MTKKMNNKTQAKHLKKRSKRAVKAGQYRHIGIHAQRQQKAADVYSGNFASLLSRGQPIDGKTLTVDNVMAMINHTIEVNAGVGSVVETLEILAREGKLAISDEERQQIDQFDEEVVKFNENAEAMNIILSGEVDLSIMPPELLMDTGFRSERLTTELCPQLMALAKPYTELVDTYQKEHYPNAHYREVMFRVALDRLARISPKYTTPKSVDAEEVVGDDAEEAHEVLDNKEGTL